MAKDDYHVIVYQILAYLYKQLKSGEDVDGSEISSNSGLFTINKKYWEYIILNMFEQGFIRGITVKRTPGNVSINRLDHCEITPEGIDYLCNNSTIRKAYEFAKDALAIVPLIL